MIVEQEIKVKWNGANKNHYISKGYKFTKCNDEFEVKVEDLPRRSHTSVKYICDFCNGENQIEEKSKRKKYSDLMIERSKSGKDCCKVCGKKRGAAKANTKNKEKIKPLNIEYPELITEWHHKNELPPCEYGYGSNQIVWWICPKGHEYDMVIAKRTIGNRNCPYCSGHRVSLDNCLATKFPEIASEWHPTKNGELTPFDFTSGTDSFAWWLGKCGHEWEARINKRTYNKGCPHCAESKGEKSIRKWLEENNINFEPQKEFNGLIGLGGKNLSYDFYLPKQNILIEYQGQYHDGSNGDYTRENLDKQQEHDKRKSNYAKSNNINLLEIWYWDFNRIEEILIKEL